MTQNHPSPQNEAFRCGDTVSGTGRRVLIAEDDHAMAVALNDGFRFEGYEVLAAENGEEAYGMAQREHPDIIVLDVMMPKKSGLDVLKQLRAAGNHIPVIILTARGREIDKVLGLKLGADDYMTKPFSMMELVVRAETILRRVGRNQSQEEDNLTTYSFGDIHLDFKKHEATKADLPLELSPREFLLLAFFVKHRGEIVTRDQLLDAVWGFQSIPFTRTVDTHVAKLRKKLEDQACNPRYIVTVHRLGYKFTG